MGKSNTALPATAVQPKPHGIGKDIPMLVIQDIESRARFGQAKYGERLRSFNGRNSLIDAYQEVLDLAVYLRQKIEEEK